MYRLAAWRPSSGTFTGRRYGDRVTQERSGPDLKAAGLWGGSLAIGPRASRRLNDPVRLMVEIVIFVVSAVALSLVGYLVIGVVLAVISIATAATLRTVMPGS
jgi:hypothetical protein